LAVISTYFEPSALIASKTINMNAGGAPFNDTQVGNIKSINLSRRSMLSDSPVQGVE
jgi:hypothetical protein